MVARAGFHGTLGQPSAQIIDGSLKFDGVSYLTRTPGSAGNRRTWTWSCWVKRTGGLGTDTAIAAVVDSGANGFYFRFRNDDDFEVADYMNEHFINIKVDREERPDVDQVYMEAVQLMTQQGGWPLNCFTTADGRPIYGGTYFPKKKWNFRNFHGYFWSC